MIARLKAWIKAHKLETAALSFVAGTIVFGNVAVIGNSLHNDFLKNVATFNATVCLVLMLVFVVCLIGSAEEPHQVHHDR